MWRICVTDEELVTFKHVVVAKNRITIEDVVSVGDERAVDKL